MEILRKDFMRVDMPKFYGSKPSFGDADILVLREPGLNMKEYIEETFKPNEIFNNGDCWSFDYKELQVDLIDTERKFYNTSLMYFSYNDLGNYIGRLAHRFGLKYGQEGLWYEHQFKGQNIGKIPVSMDYPKIFKFLGLDYERYRHGFWTLEDIFVFIAESPFFNWKMFQLESLNKINRDRNAKRASYKSFLEWIQKYAADEEHECPVPEDKTVFLKLIKETFPEAKMDIEIKRLEYEHCRELYLKAKFNGGIVMERYGLSGKNLGKAMDGFKQWITDFHNMAYDDIIMENDETGNYALFNLYLMGSDIELPKQDAKL
jgi:hypothetical protein